VRHLTGATPEYANVHHCPRERFVPPDNVYRLLHHGASSVGSETFGARVIESAPARHIAAIGEPIADAPTLYQALQTAVRLIPTHGSSKRYWLTEGRDQVWFCRGGDDLFDVGEEFVIQYALAFMVKMVRSGGWRRMAAVEGQGAARRCAGPGENGVRIATNAIGLVKNVLLIALNEGQRLRRVELTPWWGRDERDP
jgi:hypothetical protein